MPKLIKVSGVAYEELKRRATVEGRTMVVVVDRLLQVAAEPVKAEPVARPRKAAPTPQAPASSPAVAAFPRCQTCGCSAARHRADNGRCELHTMDNCGWTG